MVVLFGVGIESMGIPVPGETTLLVGVVAASHGRLSVLGVVFAGWVGAVLGDNLGYLIGRVWGERLITAPGLRRVYTPVNVAAAERLMGRWGVYAVFLGRFVTLLRIFAGPLAGMHHLPWPRFLIANALGGACWVGIVTAVGLVIGSNLDRAATLLARSGYLGLAAVVMLGTGLLTWRRRRRGRG